MSSVKQCHNCQVNLESDWFYCPNCGSKISQISKSEQENQEVYFASKNWPDRFVELLNDYQKLTKHKLESDILPDFYNHPLVGQLSVLSHDRRIRAGERIRTELKNGKFRLDLSEWLNEIYNTPDSDALTRVWTTSGGETFHSIRECRGLFNGQNYARSRGKETYRPQFVTIREARHIRGLKPCSICKPKT